MAFEGNNALNRQRGIKVNIKRFIPVAVVLAAGLAIAACSSGGSSHTSASSSNTPATAPPNTPSQQFIIDLDNQGNADFQATSNSFLLGLGKGACSDLESDGGQITPVLNDAANVVNSGNTNLTESDLGDLIGVAVDDLCPQFTTTVKQQLQAQYGVGSTTS
jgi:hypothetical protein